ncbi:hypothetical protein B0H15DRAFT_215891 [Mycena belliarum]|uniref:Elongator complex protein 5 n=1 Tax=Mycena belliarum TaxID=1033014 RepID=A0AAD6UHQ4_9AGAR|nr:hypothetical protein B0H15DRAFT_215891 [Mycena belliae]
MSFILDPRRRHQPFLLLQSSTAQSGIGILRQVIGNTKGHALLFCLLHPSLLSLKAPNVETYDLLGNVPGYNSNYVDPRHRIRAAIENASSGPLDFILDSVDVLLSDIGSVAETYKFLLELMNLIRARPSASRLVIHAVSPSPLLPLLSQPAFSPSLTHVISHPSSLLVHLSTEYLTLPPPLSTEAKFWGIFLPISERGEETERLIFGTDGEGTGDNDELVIEVILRGDGEGLRRRGVDRTLQGWSITRGLRPLSDLNTLRSLWSRTVVEPTVADPTQNVPFNLNLTASQQNSRAQVPLPYVHEGKPATSVSAAIFYDPDSADDLDDEDPDEDLDI